MGIVETARDGGRRRRVEPERVGRGGVATEKEMMEESGDKKWQWEQKQKKGMGRKEVLTERS